MGTAKRAARACMLMVAGLLAAAPLAASPSLLPSSQIAPGMIGIGKTVVLGTKISEFKVTILGVLRNAGPAGDLILFRASGPVIQSIGGLAAGMSGSPIYIGGKLAGAFSYSFQFADHTVGLFTPIADMLKVFPRAGRVARPGAYAVAPFTLGGRTIHRIEIQTDPQARPAAEDTAVALPAATPLFVSGLGETAIEEMTQGLRPMGLAPMAGPGAVDLGTAIPLEPGSAIGVALMQGDLTAYAIGTLSYRDGNRMLAFGHPFTELGSTEFLLTNATILQTVSALDHNIKVGVAGSPVGIVSEDRPAAVGGTIGVFPRMFGVRVTVRDADGGALQRFGFQVVANKDLAPLLVALGTRGAVERALNRSGEGTAEVRMVLRGRSLPRKVERINNFYSGSDISGRALAEVPMALHLLFDNDFTDVGPTDITLDVRVTRARQTGTVTDAEFPKSVQAGDTVRVRVAVRPYRGAPVTRDIDLVVPSDFPEGSALLTVRGGSTAPQPASGGLAPSTGQSPTVIRNLADAISAFEGSEKNTDVVVELTSAVQRSLLAASAVPPRVSARWTTPWVLTGRFQTSVTVGRGGR